MRVPRSSHAALVRSRRTFGVLLSDDSSCHLPMPGQKTSTGRGVSVATGAECNQILSFIAAELGPALYVVNLQVLHCAAVLAAPTISF